MNDRYDTFKEMVEKELFNLIDNRIITKPVIKRFSDGVFLEIRICDDMIEVDNVPLYNVKIKFGRNIIFNNDKTDEETMTENLFLEFKLFKSVEFIKLKSEIIKTDFINKCVQRYSLSGLPKQ